MTEAVNNGARVGCMLLGKHRLLFRATKGDRETRVHTIACSVKVRTTVHCHLLWNGSTLCVVCDLAFPC